MSVTELNISPVGRVEGDLDVKVYIDNGKVTRAHTQAAMFRGFEKIMAGKDPQSGLIVTPRICGICGGSHLYCASSALDTAWGTKLTPLQMPWTSRRIANETNCKRVTHGNLKLDELQMRHV